MSRDEDIIRQALAAQVEELDVEPYALAEIRDRIAARRRRWLPTFAVAGLAAATAAAVVVGVVSCLPPPAARHIPAGTASGTPATPGPSAPGTSAPAAPVTVRVPVYYAGNGKLYREFHTEQVATDTADQRVAAAVAEMLRAGSPADPDYATAWPAGVSVRGARYADRAVTVDLGRVPDGAPSSPRLALQQLVWTATAAAHDATNDEVTGVRLLFDGATRATLWGTGVAGPLRRDPVADVIAPLWLIEPQEGATVGRTFTVHVAGAVFEATARLRVRDGAGKPVREQMLQLSAGAPAQGEVTVSVANLPAGRYTVEVFFLSARDGSERGLDDHRVTVS